MALPRTVKFENTGIERVDAHFRKLEGLFDALGIYAGTGSPEGVVTAGVGSLYRRLDGGAATTLYVKESGAGNTGWIGK